MRVSIKRMSRGRHVVTCELNAASRTLPSFAYVSQTGEGRRGVEAAGRKEGRRVFTVFGTSSMFFSCQVCLSVCPDEVGAETLFNLLETDDHPRPVFHRRQ